MKKIILIYILAAATTATAQTRSMPLGSTAVSGLKDARKELEAQTENTILERLEAARLEDEKKRFQEFESLNFSIIEDGTSSF